MKTRPHSWSKSADPPKKQMKYRPDIDGLRALAVAPVVAFHAGLGFPGGFLGVDVFFVISGYLLSRIVIEEMDAGSFSYLSFYERRFRRLAPAFLAMVALVLVGSSATMLPEDFSALSESTVSAIFFVANFYFYNSIDYFSQSAELMPLLHTWSLAIEEQFYALLPLSVFITIKFFPRAWLPSLVLVALLTSLSLCVYYTDAYKPYAFYMPHTRAWELLAGTLLAVSPRSWLRRISPAKVGPVALLLLLSAMLLMDERAAFPGYLALAPVLATMALLWSGDALPKNWLSDLLSIKPFVFIGKISYSLYLWHWPVIVFVNYSEIVDDGLLEKLACVIISVLLAWASYRFIEEPVRRGKIFAKQPVLFTGTAISTSFIAVGAFIVMVEDGLPTRLPAELIDLLKHNAPAVHDRDCKLGRSSDVSWDPCLIGEAKAAPSFILIGDSHAQALIPGLSAAAEEQGVAGLTLTSAGFFPGLGKRSVGSGRDDPRSARMLEVIAEYDTIENLVFTASWADYALGKNWKGKEWLYQDEYSVARTYRENAAVFKRAMERLTKRLPGKRLIFLDDVPAGEGLDLNYFVRTSMLKARDRKDAGIKPEMVTARREAYVPLLQSIAKHNENTTFMPLLSPFCAGENGCRLFADDLETAIYSDGDHLSYHGSVSLKHLLYPLFDSFKTNRGSVKTSFDSSEVRLQHQPQTALFN